mmetsp:Transcript_6883/g.18663  ORF Transcript_6883/g.18663 Transcript_6883/m.18663 type:complete len:213 (-) Transcript_6883:106-744(-)
MGLRLRLRTSSLGRSRSAQTSSQASTPEFSRRSDRSAGKVAARSRAVSKPAGLDPRLTGWSPSCSSSRRGSWAQMWHAPANGTPVSLSTSVCRPPKALATAEGGGVSGVGSGSLVRTRERKRRRSSCPAISSATSHEPLRGFPARSSSSIFGQVARIVPGSPALSTPISWITTILSSSSVLWRIASRSDRPPWVPARDASTLPLMALALPPT